METYGKHDQIQVSETTYNDLKDIYKFKKRAAIDIPGKGKMQTYFLIDRKV